jgi:hypothetical protein
VNPPNPKRGHHLSGGLQAPLVLLAGHGGEGEDDGSLRLIGSCRWRWRLLEFVPPMAAPKRRRGLAAAIHGHRANPAELCGNYSWSSFFLHRRILPCHGVVVRAPPLPSGVVPGKSWSGRACRLFIAGVEQGPDRVSAIFSRVFSVIVQDLVVFSLFCRVLSVYVHPPPV